MVIQFNGLSGVKDGGMGISHKVTGNHFIIDIFQNAFQISLGSFFDLLSELRPLVGVFNTTLTSITETSAVGTR